jgi:dGTPase
MVAERCGTSRSAQLGAFIDALVLGTVSCGRVGMHDDMADALAALRAFNYERIYLRPASVAQGRTVVEVLRALVEHFADRPNLIPGHDGVAAGSAEAVRAAVSWVGGMTDRYAFETLQAVSPSTAR